MRKLIVAGTMFAGLVLPSYAMGAGAMATSYCLQGRAADGTYVYPGMVAHNFLAPGTKIYLTGRSFFGQRYFQVHDTGPALADGHFDIWSSTCSTSMAWGRRFITYKIGWPKFHAKLAKAKRHIVRRYGRGVRRLLLHGY